MAETVEEIFTSLEARFKQGVSKKPYTFYFSLDEEKWTVSISPDSCKVERGKTTETADCFVKTTEAMFVKVYNGEYRPGMSDFMSGKIKSNNPYLLKTFVDAFH
jgi:putative sterol carrier protein